MPPEKTPPQTPDAKPSDAGLRPIRTFESDVAEVLQKEHITKAKIAIAEGKRHEHETAETPRAFTAKRLSLSNVIPEGMKRLEIPWKAISVGAGALALLGIGVFLYFGIEWSREPETRTEPPVPQVPSEYSIEVTAGESRLAFIDKIDKKLADAPLRVNEFKAVPIRLDGVPMTTEALLLKLEARAPNVLVRALDPAFTFGIHGQRGIQPFIIVPVHSYDHARGGMLEWEKHILDDIGPIFNVNPQKLSLEVGTSSAEALAVHLRLKDVITRNKDARALFDADGAILFLYIFLDKETLVITTNEDTLRVLQGKVEKGRIKPTVESR